MILIDLKGMAIYPAACCVISSVIPGELCQKTRWAKDDHFFLVKVTQVFHTDLDEFFHDLKFQRHHNGMDGHRLRGIIPK